jgi:hypothetical protein
MALHMCTTHDIHITCKKSICCHMSRCGTGLYLGGAQNFKNSLNIYILIGGGGGGDTSDKTNPDIESSQTNIYFKVSVIFTTFSIGM